MKDNGMNEKDNGTSCDYSKDFTVLSPTEKQGILKTAKTLLKVQQEDTALLADAPIPHNEAKQEGLA
jgi:hypothetical protein